MKARMHALISQVSEQMYEREQIMALSLLAGIAGMNTFLYGSPGTAKSLISRRIASAFEVGEYFECLMNRFSTPEEIFGPVSIKALKDDQYLRKTEHYLPKADFAFLDEIWKASPAILNTLLTLVNEKTFKNGDMIQHVPLKVLMSASNEIPEPNQGLDALYDRFILRLVVPPIQQAQNFHALLQAKPSAAKIEAADDLRIKKQELQQWREQIHQVQLPAEVLKIFDAVKQSLTDSFEEHAVYVSDRRWQRAAYLLKASAFINDRAEVNLLDLFILKHCLWSQIDDIDFVAQTIEQAILEIGLDSDLDLAGSIAQKEDAEQRILNHFYYTDEVYASYLIRGREYLKAVTNLDHHYQDKVLYLELDKMDSKKDFFAVDESGEEIRGIVCNFNGGRQCTLKGGYYGLEEAVTPYIKYPKGSARTQLSAQVQYDLLHEVQALQSKLSHDYAVLRQRVETASAHFDSDFAAQDDAAKLKAQLALTLQRYDLQRQDCQRLEHLCRN